MFEDRLKEFFRELHTVCVRCGRKAESVQVVFATKYVHTPGLVDFLHAAQKFQAHILIGENRVQDAAEKLHFLAHHHPELRKKITPILIGSLQKNKINKAIETVDEIHSVDSLELASILNKRLEKIQKKMNVFLQVNVSGEETKHGVEVEEVETFLKSTMSLRSLEIQGLMTMAPHADDQDEVRLLFRELRMIAHTHKLHTSMGMSNDWRVAVEEGSDMIRVGSVIFR
jgi:pyridoxal phosphate enzyme (YggS family)